MTAAASSQGQRPAPATPRRWRRPTVRQVRIASGTVMFAFVLQHLATHALGLASLDAMERGLYWTKAVWRNWPMQLLLYSALATHFTLALWAIVMRRRLSLSLWEWTQLTLGLSVIPLMALHLLGVRLVEALYGTEASYTYVLLAIWVFDPLTGLRQSAGLLAAWTHACIGLHFYLRLKPGYAAWAPYLYAGALLIPVLALLGMVSGGREVAVLAADEVWLKSFRDAMKLPTAVQAAHIYAAHYWTLWSFTVLVIGAFALRPVRAFVEARRGLVRIAYPDGRLVGVPRGTSVLEASRQDGVPHAHVCGGRGRCSTCRVRVTRGLAGLPAPSEAERKVLERIAAAPDVRLACQLRPTGDLSVMPLLPPTATARDGFRRPAHAHGLEREIAVMFADLRAFTRFAERKLPYDVVFVLNRYFDAMGTAIERAGGRVDKFIGDGVMALFGVEADSSVACRQALAAARAMAGKLDELNAALAHDLDSPLRIGIGIHVGPAIVGEMGYGRVMNVTAIGDTVNTASRLETLTKDYGAQLVISAAVAVRAGLELIGFERHDIALRGRDEKLAVIVVKRAADLPAAAAT